MADAVDADDDQEVRHFRRLLQTVQERRHLTHAQLGEALGYDGETIRKYESGRRRPSKPFVEKLAQYLGVPAARRNEFRRFCVGQLPPGAGVPRWILELAHDQPGARPPGNLPAAPTPLVGRGQALTQAQAILQRPGVRLVTLTGPAGVGKPIPPEHPAR